MSKEDRRVPELRFKGFFDDWEQRKFGRLVERVSNTSEKIDLPRIEYEDIVSNQGILNKNVYVKDSSKKGLKFKKHDILFGKLRPYLNKWLISEFDGIAIGDFWVLRSHEIESRFIYNLIQTNKFKTASNISTGTRMPRSDWSIVSNTQFYIPQNNDEAINISKIMASLDNILNLHQRKINILEKQKKEYLELLFASNKDYVSKLRFSNFSNQWRQYKLEDYLSERTARSADGELISVTIDSGVVRADTLQRKDNSSENKSNYKIVKKGDIAYNSMRMWQGASGLSPYNGILSPAYTVLIPKENASGSFFSHLFKTRLMLYQFTKYSQGLTSDTWNLKYPLLKTIKVKVPSRSEQIVISEFLRKLDEVIKLHHKKIEKLLEVKQVYLTKLFI